MNTKVLQVSRLLLALTIGLVAFLPGDNTRAAGLCEEVTVELQLAVERGDMSQKGATEVSLRCFRRYGYNFTK